MWKLCKLCAQIAFLELIISFYVIHLSAVIVCQSNAVTARYEVECKFCLGSSLLCAKKRGWPHCRIYIYNYSHDTIISHHNSQDVNSNRDLAPHGAYQTAAQLIASGPAIYTTHGLVYSASADCQFCLSRCLCTCFSFLCPANMQTSAQNGSIKHYTPPHKKRKNKLK